MAEVKIVECPRDAWQALPGVMAPEVKADYLRVLVAAGFRHIDAVSFVSKEAVPQMADSELVLEYLDPPDFDAEDSSGGRDHWDRRECEGGGAGGGNECGGDGGVSLFGVGGVFEAEPAADAGGVAGGARGGGEIAYKAGMGVVAYMFDGVWEPVWGCVGCG